MKWGDFVTGMCVKDDEQMSFFHFFTLPETNMAPENGWLEY